MGSRAHLAVSGADAGLLRRARARLAELEARWSRFLPDSEVCRLNAAAGRPVQVSAETVQLLRRSVQAWEITGGLFDPTVLPAVESAGYDRTFERVRPEAPAKREADTTGPAPGCAAIEIDGGTVRLPAGVRLDLGGIGKGYAADQVTWELRQWGATGVCVNLGGDVRVSGPPAAAAAWTIGVTDPFDERAGLTTVTLAEGAVATSSRLRRRWRRGTRELHHLIDPRSGEPARSTLVAVTVVAAQAHWAEILAKSALVAGQETGARLLATHGLSALLVTNLGEVLRVGSMKEYEGWTRSSGGTSPVPAV